MTKRKPPVVAIRGSVDRDMIGQEELCALSDLQATLWRAERMTQKAALEIETRIAHGAQVEGGVMTFDSDLKMARTKRAKTGSEG
jgi:hypothetical protein